jgi:hypothetical protein
MALPKYPNLLLFLILAFAASYLARTNQLSRIDSSHREFLARFYWGWALPLYWAVSFYTLYYQPLAYEDGYGSVLALWWRSHPPETDFHNGYYYWIHWYPQLWVTAFAMTLLGALLTPRLTRHWTVARRYPFTCDFLVAWFLLLLIWIAADIGTRLEIFYVGVLAFEPDVFSTLFSITAASAVMSGIFALTRLQLQAGKFPQL